MLLEDVNVHSNMSASLQIKLGDKERECTCGRMTTIGRLDTNDIALPDPKVSRQHALLRLLGDGTYYLIDTGSANGTLVNDKRVVVPYALTDADVIKMGDHILVFRHESESVDIMEQEDLAAQTILTVGNVVQKVTILVIDIRNYTKLSEQVSVNFLATVLGSWFGAANEIVDRHDGVVDKYIGDAVMVRWVINKHDPDKAKSIKAALRTACDMNLASQTVSKDFSDLPYPLKIGVGINTGQAAFSSVDASGRRDYTALGDSVNLAFRLESATKTLNTDVVLGKDSYSHLSKKFWQTNLQCVSVKGKEDPIEVCALTFEEITKWLSGT